MLPYCNTVPYPSPHFTTLFTILLFTVVLDICITILSGAIIGNI